MQLKRPSRRQALILLGLLLVLGGGLYRYWPRPAPASLTLFGNVDIRQVDLAFNGAGRLAQMDKEEGDRVKTGEVVARIEPDTYRDLVALAEARADAQRAVVEKLVTGSRPEEIARDRAQVEADKAAVADAESVFARRKELVASGTVSRQLFDDAETALAGARARLDHSQQVYALTELGPRREDVDAGKAELDADMATLALARRRLEETTLTAPANGVVLSRVVEPGAMVGPTTPVYTIALTDKVWVRTYIAETDLGRIHPGMTVTIGNDSNPSHLHEGWIGFISPTAEFTPKTVETPELRTQLVYRLRIFVRNPDEGLRQGMPVTVHVPVAAGPR